MWFTSAKLNTLNNYTTTVCADMTKRENTKHKF